MKEKQDEETPAEDNGKVCKNCYITLLEEENERLHEELSKYGSVESLKFLLEDARKQLSDTKE